LSRLIQTRREFQRLSLSRLSEAELLLSAGHWNGAYYLAGYVVELALKACIIKMLMMTDAFPPQNFSSGCYTHNLERLLETARLTGELSSTVGMDSVFGLHWSITCRWSEQLRYHEIDEVEARALLTAITDHEHGVLAWIQSHW
jgi:hypothetical protein